MKEKNVLKFLNGVPKKVIVIPNRVVNFVSLKWKLYVVF